ncbi:hydrogenase-4 component E [Azospirillum halopraeferens]|uniref:hydrogenase-4 component E n=1 Tax=Azospirillum halopraeferens TaxID=34010 RepID=UPI00041FEBF0|nr:hydrogenase-4 component E [Azospirillum halopraeferens]
MPDIAYDASHLLGAVVLLMSFALLYQRRLFSLLNVFTLQALALSAAAAWQGYAHGEPHLYVTALLTLTLKAIVMPLALHRIIVKLNIQRAIEPALSIGLTMVAGVSLVTLSILLVLPVTAEATALTRENLALSLSVVLLGLLMMISRRNAVSQVVGFMSIENGLILAAVGVAGMPLVVEMSVAFSVMVAFIVFGIFLFHIRERFDTLDMQEIESFRGEHR